MQRHVIFSCLSFFLSKKFLFESSLYCNYIYLQHYCTRYTSQKGTSVNQMNIITESETYWTKRCFG